MKSASLAKTARTALLTVEEALYPSRVACALCGREAVLDEDALCSACAKSLLPCGEVEVSAPLDGLTAAYLYTGAAVAGMHAFKYNRQARLAPFFARAIVLPAGWQIDSVVPVPLHPLKLWLRTYNQSGLLAEALAGRLSLTLDASLLRRTRFTKTQTALDEFQRASNVAGAFVADPRVKGLNVLLVDDVTTTHSTLFACAMALRRAGAASVFAACACCTKKAVMRADSPTA